MSIHEHKKTGDTYDSTGCDRLSTSVCMRSYLHRGAYALYTHMHKTCIRKCSTRSLFLFLSPSFSALCVVLARRGKHNDGERAKLRAFVRSFVRLGLVLETGDKEGVSTAAIMIALSASPTPLRRSLQPPRQCTPRVSMHMHRRHMHAKPRRRCALVAAFSRLQISYSFHSLSLTIRSIVPKRTSG